MLKKRLFVDTALASGVAAIPVPGADVAVNTALLVHEVRHYMSVFGIDLKRVNSLKDFDHSLLKCKYLLKPNMSMLVVVGAKIGSFTALLLASSALDLILPLVESVISSVTTATITYRFLENTLQDIKYDALLIYDHIVNTNADHRM